MSQFDSGEVNPYASSDVQSNQGNYAEEYDMPAETIQLMRATRPWVLMFGIVGMIMSGFGILWMLFTAITGLADGNGEAIGAVGGMGLFILFFGKRLASHSSW